MILSHRLGFFLALAPGLLLGQSGGGYVINTVAGGFLGDGGLARAAVVGSIEKAVTDSAGNIYFSESSTHRVRRVTPAGIISTFAGTGRAGFSGDGAAAANAQLNSPAGLAFDAQGNLYIADSGNNRIRKVDAAGVISTFTTGSAAHPLSRPRGIVFDAANNLYMTSSGNGKLLLQTAAGQVSSLVTDMNNPGGVALEADGHILVADTGHHLVARVTPTGEVDLLAGNIESGTGRAGFCGDHGPAVEACLSSPVDVAVDRNGNIFIADSGNRVIRKIAKVSGQETIFTEVGSRTIEMTTASSEYTGSALSVALTSTKSVWIDSAGALVLTDSETGFGMVRKVESGQIRTVAGGNRARGDNGLATAATLYQPQGVAIDSGGNLLIADSGNDRVRRVSEAGIITAVAGNGLGSYSGDGSAALTAKLNTPIGLAVDSAGNVYIGDAGNARLRKARPSGEIITVAGGNGAGGAGDFSGATSAQVRDIRGVAVDAAGNLYLADTGNHRIRKITPSDGVIARIAGTAASGAGADGPDALQSALRSPYGVVVDKSGSVYFSDTGNHRIRKLSPSGAIETIAGTGTAGFAGDGDLAIRARLNNPSGLALDSEGNLYVADTGNHRIRHITPTGVIRTIAGTGVSGFAGDGASAMSAQLAAPVALALDSKGSIYVADRDNDRIRRLSIDNSSGRMSIVAGNNQSGVPGTRLSVPLTVGVTDLTGAPISGVTVGFSVTQGVAQLSARSAVTDSKGTASVSVTLGMTPGTVMVLASSAGLISVQFQLTIEGAIVTGQPRITSGGVVGAGGSVPAVQQLSPLGLYSVYGENFAQAGSSWQVGTGDLVAGQLPTRFQSVCVQVGSDLAPLLYVSSKQINFQAPRLTVTGMVAVQVILNCRSTGQEVKSNEEYVEFRAATPEFLYFVNNADGRNPVLAVNSQWGYVGPAGLLSGATFTPAKPGDYITVFGLGFGLTTPEVFAGELPAGARKVTGSVAISLGGTTLAESDILYVGATPGFAGLYQINIRVPDSAADGNLPLKVIIGGIPSPDGAYLAVKK